MTSTAALWHGPASPLVQTKIYEVSLATTLAEVMEAKPDVEYGPARKVNSVTRRLADTSTAASRLGFVAGINLRDGLADLVDWWRAERAATAVESAATESAAIESAVVESPAVESPAGASA